MGVFDGFGRFFGRRKPPAELPPGPSPAPGPTPAKLDDEEWLVRRMLAAEEGERDATAELSSEELSRRIAALVAAGRTRIAAELMLRASRLVEDGDDLRAQATWLFWDRGDGEAISLAESLVESATHAARAHFLLGEHWRAQADKRKALDHFEAALAIDIDYPNARARVEALRDALGRPPAAAAGETLLGPGVEVAGARYHLVRELGRGSTGVVYLARDVELRRDVAVKLLHPQLGSPRSPALRRFFTEARVAAALRHPHIVAILDLDETHRRLVMELCGGGTLRERLSRGAVPLDAALAHHREILSALASAHRRGIVHRDVKPANLLFRRAPDLIDSEVVLGDFGTAHLAGEVEGGAVGTLLYMAPEQRKGKAVAASDVFAAGVILYEMLTGRAPWGVGEALRGERPVLGLPPAFPEAVARHVLALGAPDATTRPSAEEARAEAERIRD